MGCLEDFTTPVSDPPTVDAIISDSPAVVHLLYPRTARTFSDYADRAFQPNIDRQLQLHETQRIAMVGVIHTFLAVSSRQRGRKGEREYGGVCSAKRTFQTTGRSFSVLTHITMHLMLLTRKPEATHLNGRQFWSCMRSVKHYDQQNQERLPKFHSFTVCDTVLSVAGKRKENYMNGLERSGDNRVIQ